MTTTATVPAARRRPAEPARPMSTSVDGVVIRTTVAGTTDFEYDETGVYKISYTNGKPVKRRVLDWVPITLERQDEIGTERGEQTVLTSRYVVQVGDVVHTLGMTELHDGSCWQSYPGTGGSASRSIRDVLANIVRAEGAAPETPVTELAGRSGWHVTRDGRRGYLYPNDTAYPPDFPARLAGRPRAEMAAYCAAPESADVVNAGELVRELVPDLIEHAGPSLIGIAAGARALATSLRHPRTSILLDGKRGFGKSLAEWLSAALVTGWEWPLCPIASFKDTEGGVETKIGSVGDLTITVDDCPNGANATNMEDAKANRHLESVIRSAETGGSIRDRQDRANSREIRAGNTVHGLPVISVEHRPRSMRGSLMRRCVIVRYDAQQRANARWFGENGPRVGKVLRAAGDRVIAYIHATDPSELTQWLIARSTLHRQTLMEQVTATCPTWDESLDSIIHGAAEVATGHDLLCAALGIELPDLARAIAARLIAACVYTARCANDEFIGSDDSTMAIADVLVAALLSGRAHIASQEGKPGPVLPGLSPGEQGLKPAGGLDRYGEWLPAGPVPLYYCPDTFGRPALAVNSASLYQLVKFSGDNRLGGFTALSLPRELIESGASLGSPQKDARGTWSKRGIGGGPGGARRWVVLRADLLASADDTPEDSAGELGEVEPAGPAGSAAVVHAALLEEIGAAPDLVTLERLGRDVVSDIPALGFDPDQVEQLRAAYRRRDGQLKAASAPAPAPRPAEVEPTVSREANSQSAPRPQNGAQRAGGRARVSQGRAGDLEPPSAAQRPDRPGSEPAPAYVVTSSDVVGPTDHAEVPADLPALVTAFAAGPGSEVTVMIADPKRYGITGKKPTAARPWHKAFAPLSAAGWHAEGNPGRQVSVGAWIMAEHPDHGTVRLCVLPWIDSGNPFPYAAAELGARGEVEPGELVRRADLFHQLTGQSYRGTRANTAVRLFRELMQATTRGGARYHGTAPITGPDMDPLDWVWLTPDVDQSAAGREMAHGFDGNKNHLYPTREVRLCLADLVHTGPIEYDPKRAGVFKIEVPVWPYPLLPAPTSQAGPLAWVTAPILKLYASLGVDVRIVESWSGDGVQPEASRHFVNLIRDGLTACATDGQTAVAEALKGLYQTLHGKFRADPSAIRRPDWGLAIRDESWCNTLRKVYRIAGLTEVGQPLTGALPLRVDMDEVVYASDQATPEATAAAFGSGVLVIGTDLGQFKVKTNISVQQWAHDQEGKGV